MLVEPKVSGADRVAVVAEAVMDRKSRKTVKMRRFSLMLFTSFIGTSCGRKPAYLSGGELGRIR